MAAAPVKQFTANVTAPAKLEVNGNLATNWKKFRRQWNNYYIASRLALENDADGNETEFQCAVFLATIGEDSKEVYEGLKFATAEDKKKLSKVLQTFEDHCVGHTNEAYESYQFHSRRQEEGESIEAYFACLRQLAKTCNFKDEDRMIRDQVVMGIREDTLREKLLEKRNLTVDDCLDTGRIHEKSRQQLQSMSANSHTQVNRFRSDRQGQRSSDYNQRKKYGEEKYSKCGRCGKSPSHNRQDCPAKDAECRKCSKIGHYANVCRTKAGVRYVVEEEEDESFLGTIETESVNQIEDDKWHAKIKVNGKLINFRLDTGADVTVVPDQLFRKNSPHIKPTSRKCTAAGQLQLTILGEFRATLETEKKSVTENLIIVRDLKEPLLGKNALEALHLVERIYTVDTESDIKASYPELFEGLGKMPNKYTIRMKDNVSPFSISTPRRLPLPLRPNVQDELKKMEEDDIIRPVTKPTDWCSPIVAVPKPNGRIRLCVDFTRLNEKVQR